MKDFKDFYNLLGLLIISVFVIYGLPQQFSQIVSLTVLFFAWRSKKDYLWLAFFFLIQDFPGGLFAGGYADDRFRIPIYTITRGVSFSLTELYYLLILVKAARIDQTRKFNYAPYFSGWLKLLLVLFVILLMVSVSMGMSLESYRYTFKVIVQFTLVYSIFRLIPGPEEFAAFLKALMPFVFLALLSQLYSLITKQQFAQIINPAAELTQGVLAINTNQQFLDRPTELVSIIFIAFTGVFFLYNYHRSTLSKGFLDSVLIVAFFSIMMTATRSWFMGFFLGFVIYVFLAGKEMKNVFRLAASLLVVLVFTVLAAPLVLDQLVSAWERLSTIEFILRGDLSAGGTAGRYDIRLEPVMNAFYESTVIFGAGFSDLHTQYNDYHIGYHNLLLNTGVIGALIWFFFAAFLLTQPFMSQNIFPGKNPRVLYAGVTALVVLLIINAGSQTIGFNTGVLSRNYLQAYVLLLIHICYRVFSSASSEIKRN